VTGVLLRRDEDSGTKRAEPSTSPGEKPQEEPALLHLGLGFEPPDYGEFTSDLRATGLLPLVQPELNNSPGAHALKAVTSISFTPQDVVCSLLACHWVDCDHLEQQRMEKPSQMNF
jgi:hypothetical protein